MFSVNSQYDLLLRFLNHHILSTTFNKCAPTVWTVITQVDGLLGNGFIILVIV